MAVSGQKNNFTSAIVGIRYKIKKLCFSAIIGRTYYGIILLLFLSCVNTFFKLAVNKNIAE